MSFYFTIIGHKDNPLFSHEFGTSKSSSDGLPRFTQEQRRLNQFITHASLDVVEELQWATPACYLKHVDRYQGSYVSCFLTAGNIKFLLLANPETHAASGRESVASRSSAGRAVGGSNVGPVGLYNPTAPLTEEAVKNFFVEVYDSWLKTLMNPFYMVDDVVVSPRFRERVVAAGRRYL